MNYIAYIVKFYQDNSYAVYAVDGCGEIFYDGSPEYIGSLADCEAWIRLTQAGLLE